MGYIDIKEIPTFTGYSLGQMLNDTISEYTIKMYAKL